MPIVIAGEVDLDPAKRPEALEGARALIDLALAERGCRHYAWTASPRDPGRVHVFEEWDDGETLAAHLAGPAYRGMLAHLQAFGIRAAVTRKYRCDLMEPVYGPDGTATAIFLTTRD